MSESDISRPATRESGSGLPAELLPLEEYAYPFPIVLFKTKKLSLPQETSSWR
jgi:hypothetical protein